MICRVRVKKAQNKRWRRGTHSGKPAGMWALDEWHPPPALGIEEHIAQLGEDSLALTVGWAGGGAPFQISQGETFQELVWGGATCHSTFSPVLPYLSACFALPLLCSLPACLPGSPSRERPYALLQVVASAGISTQAMSLQRVGTTFTARTQSG